MIIRRSKLTGSLVNSQAYINRPIQTLSTTLGPSLLRRTARIKDLPHLPGLLHRAARIPGPGQGLSTPFSHAAAVLTFVLM